MLLKPHNVTNTLRVLTLACRQVAEELATVAEEPALLAVDPAEVVEKSIKELFNKGYTKDPIPDDMLRQLHRGQTRSKQLSLAKC